MFRTIQIPSDNVESFKVRLAKLNKRAVKLNCEPITFNITGTELKEFNKETHLKSYFVEYTTIDIIGEDPKINGYELIAAIDHDNVLGTMINVVPGKELPVIYRESHGHCDHCNTKRNRKKTVVLYKTETAEYKEIGRQCLKDYLGTDRIDRYTMLESFQKSIDEFIEDCEDHYRSGRCEPIHKLDHVLACTIKAISDHGYLSQTKVREMYEAGYTDVPTSTCGRMWTMLYGQKGGYGLPCILPYNPTAEELEEAAKIIEWAKTIDTSSDYNYTIHKIAEAGITKNKYMGFSVSIVPAYRRAMGLIAAKEAKEKKVPSEYIGTVGERVEFDLTYLGEYSFNSYYGTCTFYRFREGENNNVVWMSSVREDFEVGTTYHVKGSVKKHQIYRDEKQTVLSRVKVK